MTRLRDLLHIFKNDWIRYPVVWAVYWVIGLGSISLGVVLNDKIGLILGGMIVGGLIFCAMARRVLRAHGIDPDGKAGR